ncbi:hypothetical protein EVAR_36220_1 [Eumeta japonica]|uniref:Uncharacterized protein n=1 Tax=Eumeta variegata TaxID=151549 RepID=A0A4C1VSX0_EUMVA|nr:hypothetical protein EVAR_36220_1 [Eumeta japonica]
MTARARVWVGDWAPARCQSMDPPDTDHCHLSRRGRVPDEKTPGHEVTKNKSSVPHLHPENRGCGRSTRHENLGPTTGPTTHPRQSTARQLSVTVSVCSIYGLHPNSRRPITGLGGGRRAHIVRR